MPDDDSRGDVWLSLGRGVGLSNAVCFQRDLYLYWQTAQRMGGLPLTTRGYVTRLALRRLCDRLAAVRQETSRLELGEAEAPELLFLRRLLERLRLLQRASDTPRLVAADWSEMGRYIALPLAERLRLAARLWVAGGWWPDQITASLQPPRLLTPAPPRLALARRRLLITLASLPRGAELPVPPARAPILPPKHHRPARLGAGREAAHTPDGVEESWRAALLGPLTWLGLVVSRPESGTGRELRSVGEAAAALAGEGPMPSLAEVHGPLALLPNLTLLAYPPLTAPALWRLDVCCEESALQQTASYTLTRRALARARKLGLAADEVARGLEELAGGALPPNVRTTLDDWERHAARIQLTAEACVLEVREAALLDALLADSASTVWVERRLAPRLALLTHEGVPRVREWLLQRGELPALRSHAHLSHGEAPPNE